MFINVGIESIRVGISTAYEEDQEMCETEITEVISYNLIFFLFESNTKLISYLFLALQFND